MQFSKEIMKGAAEVIVLQTLQDLGEAYGYQMIKSIAEDSHDIFEFHEGTLYPLLYRLEDKGLVSSEKKEAPSGKKRRYYALTPSGAKALKSMKKEYKVFLQGMQQVLRLAK